MLICLPCDCKSIPQARQCD